MKVLITEKLSPNKFIDNSGYLICNDAVLARTGKQQYLSREIFPETGDDSIIEVDRKPEQVFAAATLASFENKPLTVEHPDENVTPENYRDYAVGFVRDVHQGKYNGQDVILGTLVITDADTIEDIQNGIRTELSCGYDCDITDEPQPQQINIRGNHVALCEQGRAGIAKIIDTDRLHKRIDNLKDANDYNTYLTKLGFQWLKKMASDKEKWYFNGNETDFVQAVNNIRKERENLIESSSNDGSKTIIIIKPSALKKDSIKDEDFSFVAGAKYADEDNNTWVLKKIDGDKLYFDINGKENILDINTFKEMVGKKVNPLKTMDSIATRTYNDSDFEGKVVLLGNNGSYACVSKVDFDNNDFSNKVNLPANTLEDAIEYLIAECDVAREDIIDATKTAIQDSTDFPKYADKYREIIINQLEDLTYAATYLEKEYKAATIEELKEKLEEAIQKNVDEYTKDFNKKKVEDSEITFSNHFYEEVQKILEKKLKKYKKGTEDEDVDIEEDEYKKLYEEAKADVMKEIEKQLSKYGKKEDKK